MNKETQEVQEMQSPQEKSEETTSKTSQKTTTKGKKQKKEALYSILDLAQQLGQKQKLPKELVVVALKQGGKDKYSKSEAETLINAFKNKEVQ